MSLGAEVVDVPYNGLTLLHDMRSEEIIVCSSLISVTYLKLQLVGCVCVQYAVCLCVVHAHECVGIHACGCPCIHKWRPEKSI